MWGTYFNAKCAPSNCLTLGVHSIFDDLDKQSFVRKRLHQSVDRSRSKPSAQGYCFTSASVKTRLLSSDMLILASLYKCKRNY
jgi:hypothetical protein